MKNIKLFLFILIVVLISAACHRDLGLDGPSGTYLYLNLNFPEDDTSEEARFIHSDADELTVSLTYPGKTAIEVTFELTSTNPGPILVEDLETGSDVLLQVSVGLADSDIPLSTTTTTLDIVSGANSPVSLTLQAIDYTISGTLYNEADQILPNHTFTVDESEVITDGSGRFTLDLSTSGMATSDYVKFEIFNSETYELVRTNLYLLQNRTDFSLKASPEIYLDFVVKCEQYVLPGTTYRILEGGEVERATGTADSNGRIFYHDSNYDSSSSHELELYYNDMFVTESVYTDGAPGAEIDDVLIDPYIFFSSFDYNDYELKICRMDNSGGVSTKTVDSIISSLISYEVLYGIKLYADYSNGKIYFFEADNSGSEDLERIFLMNDWDGAVEVFDISSTAFSSNGHNDSYSVQQIIQLADGNLLLAATFGVILFDTSLGSVTQVWENSGDLGLIANGIFQDDDGSYYFLGTDREETNPDFNKQNIMRLGSSSYSDQASLPISYEGFFERDDGFSSSDNYAYLTGLYEWGSKMVSVHTQEVAGSLLGGEVVLLDASGALWSVSGPPVDQDISGTDLQYLVPIGVLPDNKFYFIEEHVTDLEDRKIYALSDPENPSISTGFVFFTNPSDFTGYVQNSFYFYYGERGFV